MKKKYYKLTYAYMNIIAFNVFQMPPLLTSVKCLKYNDGNWKLENIFVNDFSKKFVTIQ